MHWQFGAENACEICTNIAIPYAFMKSCIKWFAIRTLMNKADFFDDSQEIAKQVQGTNTYILNLGTNWMISSLLLRLDVRIPQILKQEYLGYFQIIINLLLDTHKTM